MKEIEKVNQDEVAVHSEVQEQKKSTFVGQLVPQNGHKTWQYNKVTKELTEAQYKATDVEYGKVNSINRKTIVIAENCIYTLALNRKNAMKRFCKALGITKLELSN